MAGRGGVARWNLAVAVVAPPAGVGRAFAPIWPWGGARRWRGFVCCSAPGGVCCQMESGGGRCCAPCGVGASAPVWACGGARRWRGYVDCPTLGGACCQMGSGVAVVAPLRGWGRMRPFVLAGEPAVGVAMLIALRRAGYVARWGLALPLLHPCGGGWGVCARLCLRGCPPLAGGEFVALGATGTRSAGPKGQGGDFDFPPLGPLDSLSPLETTRGQAPGPSLGKGKRIEVAVDVVRWVESWRARAG